MAGLSLGCSSTEAPPTPALIEVTPTFVLLDQGDTIRLTATVKDANGNLMPGATISFTIDKPAIASVTPTGLVSGLGAGGAVITAASGAIQKTVTVTIAGPADSLVMLPATLNLPLGSVRQLTVLVYDSLGSPVSHPTVTYRTSDSSVAVVDPGGAVHSVAVGAGLITAQAGAGRDSTDLMVVTHPAGTAGSSPVASRPFAVAISRQGLAYTGRQDVPYLQATQLPDTTFGDSVLVGSDPTDIAFSSTGATAYVTNQFSLNVGVIDVATGTSVDSIPVPNGNPFRIVVAADDRHIYVSTSTGVVFEIDPATKTIPRQWGLVPAVNGLTIAAAGAFLYATSTSGSVFEIDLGSGAVRTVSPGGTLQDIAIALDRSEIYVANEAGPLDIRSGATGMRITTVPAVTGAFGLKLSPDGTQLYATISSTGEIKIINVASRTVLLTLAVGGTPRRIAFDRFGTTALIPNESGFVSIVR